MLYADPEVAAALDAATTVDAMRAALLAAYDGRLVAPPRAVRPARRWADGAHRRAPGRRVVRLPLVRHVRPPAGRAVGRVARRPHRGDPGGRGRRGVGLPAYRRVGRRRDRRAGPAGRGDPRRARFRPAGVDPGLGRRRRPPLREVVVHSRSAARRDAFAARVRAELGVPARAVGSTPARRSPGGTWWCSPPPAPTPVLHAADLSPGTHVNAVGFKQARPQRVRHRPAGRRRPAGHRLAGPGGGRTSRRCWPPCAPYAGSVA